ncbi:MAG TPA: EAL domain-containing protein [Hyphomicrobiaceae bacterium]|nr:EAL domain-containing protein [Hyphomicrobiaceae bacterium]
MFALVPRGAGRAWLAQSASAIKRRARIHHVYYLLAAFDLAAVVSGLILTHHVNLVLSNTVKANLTWSALHDRVAELRRGAGLVNTPGNDVFESRDAAHELERFDAAVLAFWPRLEHLKGEVAAKVANDGGIARAFSGLEVSMGAMVRQTQTLLGHFVRGDEAAAAAEMAAMDRSYGDVLKQMDTFSQTLRHVENTMGLAELEHTKKLQVLEYVLGCAILLMVIAVTVYGHKLGSLFQRQWDELSSSSVKLKEQERKLAAQNLQLDAALNNMAQGLAMFDAEQRLVLCNGRYAELYGLSASELSVGSSLRQILSRSLGNSGRNAGEFVAALLARLPAGKAFGPYTTELGDGRHLAVAVEPMADGGWVTTHQDITELRRSEATITYMAHHDALTGLPNRTLFGKRLEEALRQARPGAMVAQHLLDLDHFKNVNDTLGHAAGDKLLTMVTQRLRGLLRAGDTLARMGGDEFAILQVDVNEPGDAAALARRVIDRLSEGYRIDEHQLVVGTSIGIAIACDDGMNCDLLMRNADLALYKAKGDGRGALRFFEPEMDAQMQARRSTERDLRLALGAGQFELHYQPIVDLASNCINAFEALIRWRHPEKGLIAPSQFIALAEEIGCIVALGEWALREACAVAATWPDGLKVAVNLSALQFRSPGLIDVVIGALRQSGLAAERLELEITEAVLLQDNETTLATLYGLRALGVRISMDDFGTGYSSLSYLQSFPFDKIKIDRSFIENITEGVSAINIVRAITAMARGLGMTTTAEGVETQEQRAAVAFEGCTEMQGYLFSKPLPAHDVERLYLRPYRRAGAPGAASAA